MIDKDKIEKTIEKWSSLLENINIKSKNKQFKFARILEKTIQKNDPKHYKFLIATLINLFTQLKEIKITKSMQNKEFIMEFYESDLYIKNNIMIDIARGFINSVSRLILEKLEQLDKISHLEIEQEGNLDKIFFIY